MDQSDLENRFTYHAPSGNQPEIYAEFRAAGKSFAEMIDEFAPDGREKSLAITKLEEVVMWTNAAIARGK